MRLSAFAASLLLGATGAVANAQAPVRLLASGSQQASGGGHTGGMQLSPRVRADYVVTYRQRADSRDDWVAVTVLWRGAPGWQTMRVQQQASAQSPAEREFEQARARGIVQGGMTLGRVAGTVALYATVNAAKTNVNVMGTHIDLPGGDSTLVVLVDQADGAGGSPTIVGSFAVDGRLPTVEPMKTWHNGDTTFIVQKPDSSATFIEAGLRQIPAVAAFLR